MTNSIKEAENELSHLDNNIRQAECDIEGLQNERSMAHSELLSTKTEIQGEFKYLPLFSNPQWISVLPIEGTLHPVIIQRQYLVARSPFCQ